MCHDFTSPNLEKETKTHSKLWLQNLFQPWLEITTPYRSGMGGSTLNFEGRFRVNDPQCPAWNSLPDLSACDAAGQGWMEATCFIMVDPSGQATDGLLQV